MIKLFEDYKDKNEYYQRISFQEYDESYHLIPFNGDELKILEKLFKGHSYNDVKIGINVDILPISKGSIHAYIYMFKLPDEWYIVRIKFMDADEVKSYYKCDQFDGLLKCIKDKLKL